MRIPTPNASKEDHEFIRATLILGALSFVIGTAYFFATLDWKPLIPRDATTLAVGRDFLDFWINGRAAQSADPGRLYDPHALAHELAPIVGPDYLRQTWAYPPSILLLVAPFGCLPYLLALLCWTVFGVCVFVWSASRFIPDRRAMIAVVLSPAAMLCLISGQFSFLLASTVLLVFSLLDRRPLLAGLLGGLLSLKPQYFILFPLLLVSSGRWRALLGASFMLVFVDAITTAIWGPAVWRAYLVHGLPSANLVLNDPRMIVAPFMPTLFMNLRVAGIGSGFALMIQIMVAVLLGAALAWICRGRRQEDATTAAVFLGCSACAVPYLLSYDTLALTAAAMALVAAGKLDGVGRRLAQLVYWLPLIQIGLGLRHIPGPALISLAFAIYILMRAASGSTAKLPAMAEAH